MADDEAWRRLGEMLLNRRVRLTGGTNREAFAREAGLRHSRTLFEIEKGERVNYSAATKALMEQVYRWTAGSIESVLAGGQPTELSDGQYPAAVGIKDRTYTGDAQLIGEKVVDWYLSAPDPGQRLHAIDLLVRFMQAHPLGGSED